MRFGSKVFFLLLLFSIFCNSNSIDKRISDSKQKIEQSKKEESAINSKLSELGKDINKKNSEIKEMDSTISLLQKSIEQNENMNRQYSSTLKELKESVEELEKERARIQQEIVDVVTSDVVFNMIIADESPNSPRDVIIREAFRELNQEAKNRILKLTSQHANINSNMGAISKELKNIEKVLESEKDKKETLEKVKNDKVALVKKNESAMKDYNKKLKDIENERNSLNNILKDLNILKGQEAVVVQKPESVQQASGGVIAPLEVKQIASSYRDVKTAKYSGSKTISPLEDFVVEQRYGPYFDPVYKLRVFNEAVVFGVKKRDSNVFGVLDGKVVFANDTPVLKKVVVVEHSNNLHTIYAQMDSISQGLKRGSIIKKGQVLGKVNEKLSFEVTQKDGHIDPMELITIK